jgi:hypothetical protein
MMDDSVTFYYVTEVDLAGRVLDANYQQQDSGLHPGDSHGNLSQVPSQQCDQTIRSFAVKH